MPNIIAGIATPESLRANPRILTISEPTRQPARPAPAAGGDAGSRSAAAAGKVTKARQTGTSHVHTLDVRIDRLA
jgi:hypothetical protein